MGAANETNIPLVIDVVAHHMTQRGDFDFKVRQCLVTVSKMFCEQIVSKEVVVRCRSILRCRNNIGERPCGGSTFLDADTLAIFYKLEGRILSIDKEPKTLRHLPICGTCLQNNIDHAGLSSFRWHRCKKCSLQYVNHHNNNGCFNCDVMGRSDWHLMIKEADIVHLTTKYE
jgi:hypothetical protein